MQKELVLITGATSGIGEELAKALSKDKHPLILVGRNERKLTELVELFDKSGPVEGYVCDLADAKQRERLRSVIHQKVPTWFINNAGFGNYGAFDAHTFEEQARLLSVNVTAVMEFVWEMVQVWKKNHIKGTLLNISSVAGEIPMPGMALYAASKAFVTSFSQAIDFELKKHGIRVLVACPGQVDTPFAERASGKKIIRNQGIVIKKEKVVKVLLKQIKTKKGYQLIDWRYRFLLRVAKIFIPLFLIKKKIWKSIQKRI